MTKLIPLSEHNATILRSTHDWMCNDPRPNGIACEKCGAELLDTNPNMVLTSMPPKKSVHCKKCGWSGYRLA